MLSSPWQLHFEPFLHRQHRNISTGWRDFRGFFHFAKTMQTFTKFATAKKISRITNGKPNCPNQKLTSSIIYHSTTGPMSIGRNISKWPNRPWDIVTGVGLILVSGRISWKLVEYLNHNEHRKDIFQDKSLDHDPINLTQECLGSPGWLPPCCIENNYLPNQYLEQQKFNDLLLDQSTSMCREIR